MDATKRPLVGEKLVYVTAYRRFRFQKWEWVISHFRRWPHT
jgi:hypothetical protein